MQNDKNRWKWVGKSGELCYGRWSWLWHTLPGPSQPAHFKTESLNWLLEKEGGVGSLNKVVEGKLRSRWDQWSWTPHPWLAWPKWPQIPCQSIGSRDNGYHPGTEITLQQAYNWESVGNYEKKNLKPHLPWSAKLDFKSKLLSLALFV